MNIDVDSLSAELTQELALTKLEKTLPPKLRYRFYKWLKQFKHHSDPAKVNPQLVNKAINAGFEHISAIKELKKNEMMTSLYDNGSIRMDFGGDIDPKIKKAAMSWAKKKGLKTVEASLDKADGTASFVVCSKSQAPTGVCKHYVKHSF